MRNYQPFVSPIPSRWYSGECCFESILKPSDRLIPLSRLPRIVLRSIMWSAIQSLLSRVFWLARKRLPVPFRRATNSEIQPRNSDVAIVGLVIDEHDRRLLAGLGSRNQWSVSLAESFETAQELSTELGACAILLDRDVPGREWRDAVETLSQSRHRPCVLLVSSVVDDYLWNEVVRRGGYDVLSKPLREEDLARAIKLAWAYWNSAARRHGDARDGASSLSLNK
jgi:CheY-like chemotaxis protein